MDLYDVLFYFSSGKNLKLRIKDIDNLLSLFDDSKNKKYKHSDNDGVNFIIDLDKVEYISYINDKEIEDNEQGLVDEHLTKFL